MQSRYHLYRWLLIPQRFQILRKLVDDPFLHGVTHILVDEVHERQWQVDVLLILIRNLLNGPRPDLKVVLVRGKIVLVSTASTRKLNYSNSLDN